MKILMRRTFAFCSALVFVFLFSTPCSIYASSVRNKDKETNPPFPEELKKLEKSHKLSSQLLKEIDRLEEKYPQKDVGAPKYQKSGHQYTTYIVAFLAGMGRERSHKLAFFSQFPDDEIQFSAVMASLYLWDLQYRKQVMAILHSLHGGDEAAVLERRSDLKKLVASSIKDKTIEDYQVGLIIHAFADSYAHVKLQQGQLSAFNYAWGHLFHGHEPDIIAYDPARYKEYACHLFQALSLSNACPPVLDELFEMIDRLAVSRDNELPKFEIYAEKLHFWEGYYNSRGANWAKSIGKPEVVKTIELIENAIR